MACPSGSSRGRPLPLVGTSGAGKSTIAQTYSRACMTSTAVRAPGRGRMFAMSHSFHAAQPGHGHAGRHLFHETSSQIQASRGREASDDEVGRRPPCAA
jgi:ABC-type dipeptide/oligopeptide/nickel transport system ATPase component